VYLARRSDQSAADAAALAAAQDLPNTSVAAATAVRVAEDDLHHGRGEAARGAIDDLNRDRETTPPWVRPWSWLLRAEWLDLAGERAAALDHYRKVLSDPHGQDELKQRAEEGLRRPFAPAEDAPPRAHVLIQH